MPSKRVRNGKTEWIGEIARRGLRKSKVFKTKTEASKWELTLMGLLETSIPVEDIKHLLSHGLSPEAVPEAWEREQTFTVSLLKWATDYLKFSEQQHSYKVFNHKKGVFKRLLSRFDADLPAEAITKHQAREHLTKQFHTRTGKAANNDRKDLVAAWNWGIKWLDLPAPNPFQLVDMFPHDERPHYQPPIEDFMKVFDVATDQEKLMLRFFHETAARRSEVFGLLWDDINFRDHEVRLHTRKRRGGKKESDWLPISPELSFALKEHRLAALSTEYVFTYQEGRSKGKPFTEMRGFPKDLCKKVGVKPFGLHGIRGMVSSLLWNGDAHLGDIQAQLRHQSPKTTERYIKRRPNLRGNLEIIQGGLAGKRKVA